jgi:hypothetical protein
MKGTITRASRKEGGDSGKVERWVRVLYGKLINGWKFWDMETVF